ncbi:hypothetical protein SimranZ1_99 [Mycobacterium phage SimranZ1]|nr:hypothetical protein SimranZ1_99 [Mycobacterium phage SimranZ1]
MSDGQRPAQITPNRGNNPCVCGAIHPCCRFLVGGGCPHATPGDHHHAPNQLPGWNTEGGQLAGTVAMLMERQREEETPGTRVMDRFVRQTVERQMLAEAAEREAELRRHRGE